ncbi:hypothetical protein GGR95_000993 [Sulfitobacter undariae]|uniref:Lipoprotein n=1 Tax=Sulfitobacter undariae TaxID=1563671 RepID=A0A7W6GZD1_9RHOB|nr:hypothetical protein [Sulfitobacter undariae]MBB3993365.1 hypothetical protein [Sulfitobacter undariae]
MKILKISTLVALPLVLAACSGGYNPDKSVDRGFDRKHLSQLQAGIWVDPNGCDHWIIDDGLEGYLSARLDKFGKPVCSGVAEPTRTVGDFKRGSVFKDPN